MTSQTTIDGPSSRPARQRLIHFAGAALFCCVAVAAAACGSGSTGSPSTAAPGGTATPGGSAATPTPTPASATTLSCPSASEVGGALGITVPTPTTTAEGPTGVSCNYLSGTSDVEIVVDNSIAAGYLSTAEASMAAAETSLNLNFTPVSGVGDSAYSYSYPLGSLTAQGILAAKGSTFVGIYCTATTASLSQIESLVKTLL
jgi:hypothetical protein